MTLNERIEKDVELRLEIVGLQTRRKLANERSDHYMMEGKFDGYAEYRDISNQLSAQIDAKTVEVQNLWN